MKTRLAAGAALLLAPALLLAQPAPTPRPGGGGSGVTSSVGPNPKAPAGSRPAEPQDVRLLDGQPQDPYQLERFGVAATQKGEIDMARRFFEQAWQVGELPSAPFNLACLDARAGKTDAAFKQLDRALAAGFDEEETLLSDPDLNSLRGLPQFSAVLAGVKKNRAAGDAAVAGEAFYVAPGQNARAILVVLHPVASDPMMVAAPFVGEAKARGLYLAAPRGPARAGKRRFGWGSSARADAALQGFVAAARKKAGSALPVYVVGVGRGGRIAFEVAAKQAGLFVGVGSIAGPFDPGNAPASAVAPLRGIPLVLGTPREAPPELVRAMKQGRDNLKRLALAVSYFEWPGTGEALPSNAARAAADVLDAFRL